MVVVTIFSYYKSTVGHGDSTELLVVTVLDPPLSLLHPKWPSYQHFTINLDHSAAPVRSVLEENLFRLQPLLYSRKIPAAPVCGTHHKFSAGQFFFSFISPDLPRSVT